MLLRAAHLQVNYAPLSHFHVPISTDPGVAKFVGVLGVPVSAQNSRLDLRMAGGTNAYYANVSVNQVRLLNATVLPCLVSFWLNLTLDALAVVRF